MACRGAREHGIRAQRDGDAIETLLTNLAPVALARVPVLLLLARVPLLLVLDVEQERAQAVEQSRDEIG